MNRHALDVLEYDQIIGLLENHATSGLGKRAVRRIEPLTDREEMERLTAETTELKELLAPARELPIGGLHDLFPLLEKLDAGVEVLVTEEILLIADTLRAGRHVREYLEEAEELERAWKEKLGELEKKEAELREQRGEEAFEKLRVIREEIERLCERAPSRRLLLEGLGEIRTSLQDQLEKSPQAERRRGMEIGDEVRVRSLDRVGVLSEIDRQGGKAVVKFGEIPMRVALEDIDAAG